jgi:Ankyrin repeats (3 copies)
VAASGIWQANPQGRTLGTVTGPSGDQALIQRGVDAVCAGDAPALRRLLHAHPGLVTARIESAAVPYDGYFHQATLLHHVAGNPLPPAVPENAVEIARLLLDAGAAVDARTRGGPSQPTDPGWTVLGLVVTCTEPVIGSRRDALVDLLVAAGADVEDANGLPLAGAIHYDVPAGIAALRRHGARLDVRLASGVGDLERVREFFSPDGRLIPGSSFLSRYPDPPAAEPAGDGSILNEALVYACHGSLPGKLAVARFLIDRGARPTGVAFGITALHAAAWSGNTELVRLLLGHGADLAARDRVHNGTPADWAAHNRQPECVEVLQGHRN